MNRQLVEMDDFFNQRSWFDSVAGTMLIQMNRFHTQITRVCDSLIFNFVHVTVIIMGSEVYVFVFLTIYLSPVITTSAYATPRL